MLFLSRVMVFEVAKIAFNSWALLRDKAGHQLVRWLIHGVRLRRWLVFQRDTNEMVVLKRVLRDYPVASCPAISQNTYMYPRAGEVIETAGQLGTCPQKVLANDASFCVPKGYQPLAEGTLDYEH